MFERVDSNRSRPCRFDVACRRTKPPPQAKVVRERRRPAPRVATPSSPPTKAAANTSSQTDSSSTTCYVQTISANSSSGSASPPATTSPYGGYALDVRQPLPRAVNYRRWYVDTFGEKAVGKHGKLSCLSRLIIVHLLGFI